MVSWESLIRFTADDSVEYWAALALDSAPKVGLQVEGFSSIEDLESDKGGKKVVVKQVRAFESYEIVLEVLMALLCSYSLQLQIKGTPYTA